MEKMKYRDKSRACQSILYGSFALSLLLTFYVLLYNPYGSTQIQHVRSLLNIASQSELLACQEALKEASLKGGSSILQPQTTTATSASLTATAAAAAAAKTAATAGMNSIQPIPVANLGKSKNSRETFEATIKSCLGSYCKSEIFDDEGKKINRIGILLPDNTITWDGLISSIKALDPNEASIKIIKSAHVPPYGYGRNHGWTKIVRIVDRLPNQAYRFIVNSSSLTEQYDSLKLMYEIQVRQLVRWHCRLNHVAAHTTMLSIFVDDFLHRPEFELQKLISFIGYKASKEQLAEILGKHFENFKSVWFNERSHTTSLPKDLNDIFDSTIVDEMNGSDGLSMWPCNSFLDLEKRQILPHMRYYELAADCTNPDVKCTISYDKKEQQPAEKSK